MNPSTRGLVVYGPLPCRPQERFRTWPGRLGPARLEQALFGIHVPCQRRRVEVSLGADPAGAVMLAPANLCSLFPFYTPSVQNATGFSPALKGGACGGLFSVTRPVLPLLRGANPQENPLFRRPFQPHVEF